ncbi:hypothetical protein [Bacteriovorax sp. DB6_IX]|uniref:hypothetical protein n=1 Tax=Bacteriovorax sp. DB6_IX TaxID=1353530 RepID=UPI00038A49F8|nr:hypothetical protein [Bacteriovorax sp. DB6_IX]EQC52622.1 hypothetical protein M901_1544 [Bacteriovorax sp. DB6_IX]
MKFFKFVLVFVGLNIICSSVAARNLSDILRSRGINIVEDKERSISKLEDLLTNGFLECTQEGCFDWGDPDNDDVTPPFNDPDPVDDDEDDEEDERNQDIFFEGVTLSCNINLENCEWEIPSFTN